MELVNKELTEDMYTTMLQDREFMAFLSKDQIEAYKYFLKVKFNKDLLVDSKKAQIPEYHAPTRTFYSNYHLLPPYKVLREANNHGSFHYSLKKISDDLTVDTSTNFWKPRLYWMRIKTWTINCLVFLVFSVWKGPVGLRCLYGIDDFKVDTNINYNTG